MDNLTAAIKEAAERLATVNPETHELSANWLLDAVERAGYEVRAHQRGIAGTVITLTVK